MVKLMIVLFDFVQIFLADFAPPIGQGWKFGAL